ncbi:hypothetical protein B0T19DRAFT_458192 [Cercophora scortea]|uniref:histidine kinase n=1 Tax=Cercophora scortea TaxID=314031 RepID=A0AAE0IXI6_9PEZI|nr:hypothetical protein B0T19DRAFT_458192 [Cercophora scortea]
MILDSEACCYAVEGPPPVDITERARQREIAAYLSAASFPAGLPSGLMPTPFLNADPTLNALVQLGALRLDCDRSFLSLIDRQYQFVASEMTRTHSLKQVRAPSGEPDTIFLGVTKLDACWGVCPTTMKAFMDETGEWARTGPNVIANKTRYIINDFTADPDYMHRPYVTGYPFMRSYLEVPLVSPLGYLLGSYCVVDNKLHDFDDDAQVDIMNEIADAIMAHLENNRAKQSRHRSEVLIQGLSAFIRDEPSAPTAPGLDDTTYSTTGQQSSAGSTLLHDSDATSPATAQPAASAASSALEHSFGPSSGSSTNLQRPQSLTRDSSTTKSTLSGRESDPNPSLASSTGYSVFSPTSNLNQGNSSGTPPTTPPDEAEVDPIDQHMRSIDSVVQEVTDVDAPPPPSPPLASGESDVQPEVPGNGFLSSANIKSTFFRAAATIRQSMNIDGLMFLDAVPSSFADRSDQPVLDTTIAASREEAVGPFCGAIVQSALDQEGEILKSSQTRLPEATLQRFIRRFPRGHIFSADEFGPIDETYGIGKSWPAGCKDDGKAQRENLRLRNDVATLFRVLPAAKYVLFLPLWHFQRECWYAAALGWVADPTRAIDSTDISLVSAFGNSVMAEVSRLEALAASRAKSNFVSSISHELRSPLHGILASSELLREGLTDHSLLSTLDMLDSCGTTLLDTFNNLLDHAIAIDAGKSSKAPVAHIQFADLGGLVEDVVEAVKISHLYENAPKQSLQRKGVYTAETSIGEDDPPDRPLLVILNIGKRPTWKLPVAVGAWKRIVMNIFSNALKYTISGRIEVGLKEVQRPDSKGQLRDYIAFSVEDTGGGMSSDYLKYQLFTPFSQENSHSPGMGLGLSIVQQLAHGLGGTVHVRSSLGVGTLVEVLIPLIQDAPDPASSIPTIETTQLSHKIYHTQLEGRTACLITPEAYLAMANKCVEVTNEMRNRSAIVERALKINAGEALGMKVILGTSDCPVPEADLYFLDGNLPSIAVKGHVEDLIPTQLPESAPLVVLCSGAGSHACLKQEVMKSRGIHLHHPIGPRKLGSVLASALTTSMPSSAGQEQPLSSPSRGQDNKEVLHGKKRSYIQLAEPDPSDTGEGGPMELSPPDEPPPHPLPNEIVPPTPALNPPGGHHLLLVDDNPINMKLLTTVVRKLNHTFATACNGLEAVQLYRSSLRPNQHRFSMVFMDISMPVMDGFKATREIRQLENEAKVAVAAKIVALTGLSGEVSRKEAFASGSDLFLTKPIRLERVRRLLDGEGEGEGG